MWHPMVNAHETTSVGRWGIKGVQEIQGLGNLSASRRISFEGGARAVANDDLETEALLDPQPRG